MRILIIGASGMLGHKLVQRLERNFEVAGTIRGTFATVERYGIFDRDSIIENVDVLDIASVERAVVEFQPDVVINAVGVIKQVPTVGDAALTIEINSVLPHRLAALGDKHGFRLITLSTDCVFDGVEGNYSEADRPNAYDLYGKSKHLGEVTEGNSLTIRSSIIGRELSTSHSLIEWFLSNRGQTVKGFTTAIYSGFPTVVFADIIESLIVDHRDLNGLFHISSEPINKFELLKLVSEAYGADIRVEPTDELVIDRSLDSTRFRGLTGFVPMPWEEMIRVMADDLTPYETIRNETDRR